MSFTCPVCKKTSDNPNDEKTGYCGHCHTFPEHREFFAKTQRELEKLELQIKHASVAVKTEYVRMLRTTLRFDNFLLVLNGGAMVVMAFILAAGLGSRFLFAGLILGHGIQFHLCVRRIQKKRVQLREAEAS